MPENAPIDDPELVKGEQASEQISDETDMDVSDEAPESEGPTEESPTPIPARIPAVLQ